MLAKLNLKAAPSSQSLTPLTPAQLAHYRSLMKVLEQDSDSSSQQESNCGTPERITHFSKHLRMYSPEAFVPTEKPEVFNLGKKIKLIRFTMKAKTPNSVDVVCT